MSLFLRAIALVSALTLGSFATAATAGLPVAPFQARYEVYGSGFSLGEAVMTLAPNGSAGYRMSTEVRPNGLAALIVSGQLDENVSGEIHEGQLWPDQYERRTETRRRTQTVQLKFDWPAGQVQARDNEERARLPVTPGMLDPLSLNLRVMWDLQSGRLPDRYTLVDETKIRTFQIRNEGEETLDTPLGALRALRVSHSRPGRTRITTFWFAPDLHYLPVRVAQESKGKEQLRMEIRAVERQP
jgi:hypothetical protein